MVAYLMKISDPNYPFFLRPNFNSVCSKRIRWIVTSPYGPIKIPCNRSEYVEVHCVIIDYANGKAKPIHYLVQLVDLDNPNYQQQELFLE